jgi:MFS family permease
VAQAGAVLALCVVVWSVFTALCGLSQNFSQLFACSMGIAVGEAVLGPITYALIADLFPPQKWLVANYVYFVTGVLGGAAGMAFSGAVIGLAESAHTALPAGIATLDPWRIALLLVAVPGPVLGLLILVIRRASRGAASAEAGSSPGLLDYFKAHLRSSVGVFGGFGFVAAAQGTLAAWVPVVLVRELHESPATAGVHMGFVMMVGSLAGVAGSYGLMRGLRRRNSPLPALKVAQAGAVLALLGMPLYFIVHDARLFYGVVALQGAATVCALSLSPTVLQLMAPSSLRGRVIAVGGLVYLVLLSLSPVIVGAISDAFGQGRPGMLLNSILLVAAPCYLLGAMLLRFAQPTLLRTFAAVEGR